MPDRSDSTIPDVQIEENGRFFREFLYFSSGGGASGHALPLGTGWGTFASGHIAQNPTCGLQFTIHVSSCLRRIGVRIETGPACAPIDGRLRRADGECAGWLTGGVDLPHRRIGSFEVSGEERCVEQ